MNNDFTWEKIADWIDGRLPEHEAAALAAQLMTMKNEALPSVAQVDMQADIEWLRAFQKLSANVPLKHLSEAARQKLRRQFQQMQSAQHPESQPLAALARAFRSVIATLASDSWQTPLVGVRYGEVPRDSRQLIYTSHLAEIALNIRPRKQVGLVDLRCQLFASTQIDLQTVSAQLVRNNLFFQTQVSDLGDFAFSSVMPGEYELTLGNDDFEIAISRLTLAL